jgi:DNA-directed RNA polymerase specialized sigma24 family protein
MRRSMSRDDLRTVLHEADVAARRLLRQLRLPRQDLDDLRQDLLADLIVRLRGFDPERGSLGAFSGIVLANRSTRIATKVKRERRLYGAAPVSLDETISESEGLARGDIIGEDEGLAAYFGHPADAFAAVERRLDLERGLGSLDLADGQLCASLAHTTVNDLAGAGRGARSCLYRRVKNIRLALTAIGLTAA